MIVSVLAVALAIAQPVSLPDGAVLLPIAAAEIVQTDAGHCAFLRHETGGISVVDVGLLTLDESGQVVLATDRLETTWKDASGRTHTVVTELPGERDPDQIAKRHNLRVVALERLYPPVRQ